jgi:hypothetical protein
VRNSFDATALLWAAGNAAKARLLVEHGADVNAASKQGRTPAGVQDTNCDAVDVSDIASIRLSFPIRGKQQQRRLGSWSSLRIAGRYPVQFFFE